MTYDQISEYLKSGKLDQPDAELDVYHHLRPGQTVAEGLAELAVTEDHASASTVNEAILDTIDPSWGALPDDEIEDLPTVPVGTPLNFKASEEQPAVLAPAASHRGRKTQYDVSPLAPGQHLVYKGILSSARVMASLKGKSYDYKREFKATEVEGEIRITRVK